MTHGSVPIATHKQVTHKGQDPPTRAKHVQRCSHAIHKTVLCTKPAEEWSSLVEQYLSIECCCEGHGIATVQRACEGMYQSYTELDMVFKSKPAIELIEMMDLFRRDKSDVKGLESVLVKAKVPPENVAFMVVDIKLHHGSDISDVFRDVLKVLLIHLTGNTNAVSGEQLISELPYGGTSPLVD